MLHNNRKCFWVGSSTKSETSQGCALSRKAQMNHTEPHSLCEAPLRAWRNGTAPEGRHRGVSEDETAVT